MLHKKVLLALTASLICQESLFAKEKDYTLGKVSTSGKKDRSDYSGQVNLGYSGITAPKSWQDEEVKKYTGSRTVISNKRSPNKLTKALKKLYRMSPVCKLGMRQV